MLSAQDSIGTTNHRSKTGVALGRTEGEARASAPKSRRTSGGTEPEGRARRRADPRARSDRGERPTGTAAPDPKRGIGEATTTKKKTAVKTATRLAWCAAAALACCVTIGCSSSARNPASADCDTNDECKNGFVCSERVCTQVCGDSSECAATHVCDAKQRVCVKAPTPCVDADQDSYGRGPACVALDCDDSSATCTIDCTTDLDADGLRDCDDPCVDVDHDGHGAGAGCVAADCDDSVAACTTGCTDLDADGLRDCDLDTCVDVDGDGLGRAGFATTSCANATIDSDDNDVHRCADTDGDTCDDCALLGKFAPRADGTDVDGDGFCAAGDCNDNDPTVYPGRAELCNGKDDDCDGVVDDGLAFVTYFRDVDGDGRGDASVSVSACAPLSGYVTSSDDCDDTVPDCTTDCVSNTDGPGELAAGESPVVDCVERYCGSNPANAGSSCIRVNSMGEWQAAAALVNSASVPKSYDILLGSFTATALLAALSSTTVPVHVKQEAGRVVTVSLASVGGPMFDLRGALATIGPLHVVVEGNAGDIVGIDGNTNRVNDVVIDGKAFVGISTGPVSYDNVIDTVTISGATFGMILDGDTNTVSSATISGTTTGVDFGAFGLPSINNSVTSSTISATTTGINFGGTGSNNSVTSTTVADAITGIHIASADNTVTATVTGTSVSNFRDIGIHIDGSLVANAKIAGCTITGGTGAPAIGRAALVVSNAAGGVYVVNNLIAGNAMDGVHVNGSFAAYIDQNTIANNGGAGLHVTFDLAGPCPRNNNIVNNIGTGIATDNASALGWYAFLGCTDPLATSGTGPLYGNNSFGNASDCAGCDSGCDCLPSGVFWQFNTAPAFVTTSLTEPAAYCLGAATLEDAGADLTTNIVDAAAKALYDLNGANAGTFNAAAPDIGGRESGSGGCP